MNRRPHPYQGCALPTEPQQHCLFFYIFNCRDEVSDLFSSAVRSIGSLGHARAGECARLSQSAHTPHGVMCRTQLSTLPRMCSTDCPAILIANLRRHESACGRSSHSSIYLQTQNTITVYSKYHSKSSDNVLFIKNFSINGSVRTVRRERFSGLLNYDFFSVVIERDFASLFGRARNDISGDRRFDMRLNKPF